MTTTGEALSGPWAANVRGGVVTGMLSSVIVITQEVTTALPAGWIAATVVLQMAACVAWVALVAGISRRRYGRVVPVASGLLWTGIGVARGVVGALVATAAGLDPEWAYRIGFWTLVALFWMPLLTYALAQWDEHRRLLAVRTGLTLALDDAAQRAAESADDTAERMRAAVDDALSPALDEIRARLREETSPDEAAAAAIAGRLDELAARTAAFTALVPVHAPPRTTGRVSVSAASREFELRRPVFAALLAAVGTAPLVVPEAYREGGWGHVAEATVAIAASTSVLIGAFALLRSRRFTGAQRSLLSRIGVIVAGLVGSAVLLLVPWEPFEPRDLVLIAVFPLVVATAASTIATAVAFEATNVELAARSTMERIALDDLTARALAAEKQTAARLQTLIRGEVNGRVASCALALGMLANGGVPAESRERVLEGVIAQLDAAAAELQAG